MPVGIKNVNRIVAVYYIMSYFISSNNDDDDILGYDKRYPALKRRGGVGIMIFMKMILKKRNLYNTVRIVKRQGLK